MKNIWKKTPAWIKTILLNILWLYPMVLIIGQVIRFNLTTTPTWGWGLILIIVLLAGFWYLVKKFTVKVDNGINLEVDFWRLNIMGWAVVIGLVLSFIGIFLISASIFDFKSTGQYAFITSFRQFNPWVSLPLLAGLALMAGIVEETLYRGIMQNTLRKYPRYINYTIIALLFAFAHFLPKDLFIPYMIFSVLFSIVADKLKTTRHIIAAHFLFDLTVFYSLYFNKLNLKDFNNNHVYLGLGLLLIGGGIVFFGTNTKQKVHQENVAIS